LATLYVLLHEQPWAVRDSDHELDFTHLSIWQGALEGSRETLIPLILGTPGHDTYSHLIACDFGVTQIEPFDSVLQLQPSVVGDVVYTGVLIQLFARLGLPRYWVIAGERKNENLD
jgi:hypothetical protein